MAKFTSESGRAAGKKSKRAKSIKDIILAKTANGHDIVNALLKIIKSVKTTNRDRIAAAKLLLEYAIGKPVQAVDATMDGTISFSWEGDDLSVNI